MCSHVISSEFILILTLFSSLLSSSIHFRFFLFYLSTSHTASRTFSLYLSTPILFLAVPLLIYPPAATHTSILYLSVSRAATRTSVIIYLIFNSISSITTTSPHTISYFLPLYSFNLIISLFTSYLFTTSFNIILPKSIISFLLYFTLL